jgi:hypothetical protein
MVMHNGYPRLDRTLYDALQLQLGPHLHASPHAQPVVLAAAVVFWHPHLHVAPAQFAHAHFLVLLVMIFPLSGHFVSWPKTVSHQTTLPVLNETAVVLEQIG